MLPREIIPGRTYFITRNVAHGEHRLRPSRIVNQLLLFCLAIATRATGVRLHSHSFLENHYHTILTDTFGVLPLFVGIFNSLVARALNLKQGRSEYFWRPGSYNCIPMETLDDLLHYLAYTHAQPVEAGLVARAVEWPGLQSSPEDLGGKVHVASLPKFFFSKRAKWPRKVKVEITAPTMIEGREEKVIAELERRLRETEVAKKKELEREGRKFKGRKAILAGSPFQFPRTERRERGTLNPHVASRHPEVRKEAIRRLQKFRSEYALARELFKAGHREVLFPPGTYGPRVVYGARVRPPPT